MQVGAGLIVIELRRSDGKDRVKRQKEAEYREAVEQEIRDERRVSFAPLPTCQ